MQTTQWHREEEPPNHHKTPGRQIKQSNQLSLPHQDDCNDDKQADVIDAFNTTSRYLDDILIINNVYFENMVSQIYPSELQLNKANASDTEAAFLDLHLSISNDSVSTKIYDKRDDFDFEIVNFPFLDGDVPRSTSYGVYILNSFVLLEHLAMLLTSILAINC